MDYRSKSARLLPEFEKLNLGQLAKMIRTDAPLHWNERSFNLAAWQQLVNNRFLEKVIPAPWGEGEDWADGLVLVESISRNTGEAGFSIALAAQLWLLRALVQFSTPAQAAKWVPRLLAGDLGATAIAEAHSGSDLSVAKTQLKAGASGNFLLSGSKSHISLAAEASLVLVPVMDPERKELRLVWLDKSSAGVSVGKKWDKMGFRTLPTADLRFENVEIQGGDLIENGKNLAEIMAYARILYGMISSALGSFLGEEMTRWALNRGTGDKPVAERQFIQERITQSALACEQARLMSIEAMTALSLRENDRLLKCSMAKMAGAKAFRLSGEHALAIMGSQGYEEGPVSRALRDSFGFISSGGTEEFHKRQIYYGLKRGL